MKKRKYKTGDILLVYRLPIARKEAEGSQAMYPAYTETGVLPGCWSGVPPVGPLVTLTTTTNGLLTTTVNGLQKHELKHQDHEKEAWLGTLVEISGDRELIFPTSYMVKWFYPVFSTRVYCGIGPPGTMNIYDSKISLFRRLIEWFK